MPTTKIFQKVFPTNTVSIRVIQIVHLLQVFTPKITLYKHQINDVRIHYLIILYIKYTRLIK